jgi:hypothetical protein
MTLQCQRRVYNKPDGLTERGPTIFECLCAGVLLKTRSKLFSSPTPLWNRFTLHTSRQRTAFALYSVFLFSLTRTHRSRVLLQTLLCSVQIKILFIYYVCMCEGIFFFVNKNWSTVFRGVPTTCLSNKTITCKILRNNPI